MVSQSFVYKKETPFTLAQIDTEGDGGYINMAQPENTYTALQKPDVNDAEQKPNDRDVLYDDRTTDQSLEQGSKTDEYQPEYVVLNSELVEDNNEEDSDNETGDFDPVYFQLERVESTKEDQPDNRRDSAPRVGSDNDGYLDVKELSGPVGEYDTLARVGKVNSMKVETETVSSDKFQPSNRRDSAPAGGSDNYGYLDVKELSGPVGEYDTLARVGKVNSMNMMKVETATVSSDDTYQHLGT